MPETKERPFKADANALATALAVGHKRRKGHKLRAHWVAPKDSEVWELVRDCCPADHHVLIQVGRQADLTTA